VCALLWSAFANAQGSLPAPPIRPAVDANGIELVSGYIQLSTTDIVVGQLGAGGMSYTRTYGAPETYTWYDQYSGDVWNIYDDGVNSHASIAIGTYSEDFAKADSPAGSPYVSSQGTGATLTENSTTYTYTSPDGTVSVFSKNITTVRGGQRSAWITSMTFPDGEIQTFNYFTAAECSTQTGCGPTQPITRLQSVTNNRGYQIKLLYSLNGTNIDPTQAAYWNVISGVMGINMAVDYCDPLAPSCTGTTQTWPTATYNSFSVTDLLGNVTTSGPSGGCGWSVRWPGNQSDNITYTTPSNSCQISKVTRNGQAWNYSYSSAGSDLTTVVTDPLNRTSTYVFDAATHAIKSYRNTAGELTTYQNDSSGRPTTITLPTNQTVQYKYDARGNVYETHRTAYPAGSPDLVWTSNFDASCTPTTAKKCNQPNWTRDPAGNQTDYTYDNASGKVSSVTLPAPTAGAVRPSTTYTYAPYTAYYKNASGTIVADGTSVYYLTSITTCRTTSGCSSSSSDQLRSDLNYGSDGVANNRLLVSKTDHDGANSIVAITTMEYDAVGNQVAVNGPLGSSVQRSATKYDLVRRVVGRVGPDPDGSGPRLNIGVRTTYDSRGFATSLDTGTLPGQTDSAWQSFVPAQTVVRQFDAEGRVTQNSLAAAGTTYSVQQMSYDSVGRLDCSTVRMNSAAFTSPPPACSLGAPGSFGPDRILKYSYDNGDRMTSVVSGSGTSTFITKQTSTYFPGGQLQTIGDGAGHTTTYSYDPYGRLYRMYYPDPTTVGSSSTTDYEELGYDLNSNVISTRRRSGDVIQTPRDALGRVTVKSLPSGSAESVYFAYDNQGRLLSALYNNAAGNGITQTYDGLGRLATRTAFGRQLSYGYDLASRRTRVTHPDGFYVTYGYTNADELASVTDSTGVTVASYSYNSLGARTQLSRPNNAITTYTPDAIERLQQLTQDLSGTSFDTTAAFTYNPAGQLASKTQSNDGAYTWLPSPANRTISSPADPLNRLAQFQGTNVFEDTNGNVQSGINNLSYTYDVLGQLRQGSGSTSTVNVDYDPSGMLRRVTNGSTVTEYLYDGPDLVAEYVNGALARRFAHGAADDEPLVWYEGSGTGSKTYLHADERGSIVTTSDANGAATMSVKYSSYGESGTLVSPFGFTGQLYLPDLQLYYYKARMYSPQTGRFLQPDPIGYTDNLNLYTYTGGDPVNLADPSGQSVSDVLCALLGIGCQTVTVGASRSHDCGPGDIACLLDDGQSFKQLPPWAYNVVQGPPSGAPANPYQPPQGGQSQNLSWKKIQNWLCTAGNSVAAGADGLANVSGKLELAGLATAGIGTVTAQPELSGFGLLVAATGGAGNISAGVLQFSAGGLQGIGGGGFANSGYAAVSLATGFGIARGILGPAVSGYRTVSQRAGDAFAKGTATVAGGVNDLVGSFVDAAAPRQVGCPGGN
jgi:RHS repeat-associated protein